MPIRERWAEALKRCVEPAIGLADQLAGRSADPPVDLVHIAEVLSTEIIVQSGPATSHGRTSRHRNGYRVIIGGANVGHLTGRQRFSIAHELAHVIFLDLGVPPPAGKGEYWRLEEECNRVAGRILVPRWVTPDRSVVPADVVGWLHSFMYRCGLTAPAAAKEFVQSVPNAEATVGLRSRADERCVVSWHLTTSDVTAPYTNRVLAEDDPLALLHRQVVHLAADGYCTAEIENDASLEAVGVASRETSTIIYLRRTSDADQLQLFASPRLTVRAAN